MSTKQIWKSVIEISILIKLKFVRFGLSAGKSHYHQKREKEERVQKNTLAKKLE